MTVGLPACPVERWRRHERLAIHRQVFIDLLALPGGSPRLEASCQTGLRILRRCRGRLHHRTHADGYGFAHLGRSGRRHRRRRWCLRNRRDDRGRRRHIGCERTAVVGLGGIRRVTSHGLLGACKIHLVDRPQMPPCRFVGGVDHQRLTVGGAGEFKLSALLPDPAEGVVVGRLALVARHRLFGPVKRFVQTALLTGKQVGKVVLGGAISWIELQRRLVGSFGRSPAAEALERNALLQRCKRRVREPRGLLVGLRGIGKAVEAHERVATREPGGRVALVGSDKPLENRQRLVRMTEPKPRVSERIERGQIARQLGHRLFEQGSALGELAHGNQRDPELGSKLRFGTFRLMESSIVRHRLCRPAQLHQQRGELAPRRERLRIDPYRVAQTAHGLVRLVVLEQQARVGAKQPGVLGACHQGAPHPGERSLTLALPLGDGRHAQQRRRVGGFFAQTCLEGRRSSFEITAAQGLVGGLERVPFPPWGTGDLRLQQLVGHQGGNDRRHRADKKCKQQGGTRTGKGFANRSGHLGSRRINERGVGRKRSAAPEHGTHSVCRRGAWQTRLQYPAKTHRRRPQSRIAAQCQNGKRGWKPLFPAVATSSSDNAQAQDLRRISPSPARPARPSIRVPGSGTLVLGAAVAWM